MGVADVAVVGLAKRLEEVWLPDDDHPLVLPRTSQGLYLLQRLRDEAHRFAIGKHRARRTKGMTASELDTVPGLGPARRKALLDAFGSVRAVRAAEAEEIAQVKGIGPSLAAAVLAALRPAAPAPGRPQRGGRQRGGRRRRRGARPVGATALSQVGPGDAGTTDLGEDDLGATAGDRGAGPAGPGRRRPRRGRHGDRRGPQPLTRLRRARLPGADGPHPACWALLHA